MSTSIGDTFSGVRRNQFSSTNVSSDFELRSLLSSSLQLRLKTEALTALRGSEMR